MILQENLLCHDPELGMVQNKKRTTNKNKFKIAHTHTYPLPSQHKAVTPHRQPPGEMWILSRPPDKWSGLGVEGMSAGSSLIVPCVFPYYFIVKDQGVGLRIGQKHIATEKQTEGERGDNKERERERERERLPWPL